MTLRTPPWDVTAHRRGMWLQTAEVGDRLAGPGLFPHDNISLIHYVTYEQFICIYKAQFKHICNIILVQY